MNLTERKESESYLQFMKRIVAMRANKQISYTEMGDALLGDGNVYSKDNLRKGFYVLNKVCRKIDEDTTVLSDSDTIRQIQEERRALEEDRVKFRDERTAYNAQVRNAARLDRTFEYLSEKLSDIGTDMFKAVPVSVEKSDNDLLIVLSDLHFGQTFYSAFGLYDSDIAKERLQKYLGEIIEIQKRHKSENAYILLAGDLINNSIHKTIAITNRENVIDQIKMAVDYISAFCYELSKHFVNVYLTDCAGNHSRLDRKEDALHDERLDTLIAWTVGKLLHNVENFHFEDNRLDTGICSMIIRDRVYVGVHGDFDDLSKSSISRLILMLGYTPYACVMGHRHFPAVTDESGIRVVQGGSLAGAGDDYTIEKRLSGKPSQTVCVCTDRGIECVYPVMLDK